MDDYHDFGIKQTECHKAVFAVVKTGIMEAEGRSREDLVRVSEVKAVFLSVCLPLPFIPCKLH